MAHVAWDADAGAAVGNTGGELVDVGCLMEARQAPGVVQPSFGVVGTDVVLVTLAQFLDGFLNVPVKEAGRGEGSVSEPLLLLCPSECSFIPPPDIHK